MALGALASGCVYRINIQQGNFLDQAAVEQDKVARLDKPTAAEAAAQDASAAQIKNGRTY
jgi:hypothetical protein